MAISAAFRPCSMGTDRVRSLQDSRGRPVPARGRVIRSEPNRNRSETERNKKGQNRTMRTLNYVVLVLVLASFGFVSFGCGDSDSPTAPSVMQEAPSVRATAPSTPVMGATPASFDADLRTVAPGDARYGPNAYDFFARMDSGMLHVALVEDAMQTMRNASQPHRMRQVEVYHVPSEPRHVLQTHGDPIYSGTVRLSGRLELPPIAIDGCASHEWIIVQAAELSDDRYDGWRNAPCPQPNGVVVGSDGSGPGWERSEHGAPPRNFPEPEPTPMPEPDPTPMPEPDPTPMPEPDPTPMPEPDPTPMPEPDPTPMPEPEWFSAPHYDALVYNAFQRDPIQTESFVLSASRVANLNVRFNTIGRMPTGPQYLPCPGPIPRTFIETLEQNTGLLIRSMTGVPWSGTFGPGGIEVRFEHRLASTRPGAVSEDTLGSTYVGGAREGLPIWLFLTDQCGPVGGADALVDTFVHELGHSLGFWHVHDESWLMYPLSHARYGLETLRREFFHMQRAYERGPRYPRSSPVWGLLPPGLPRPATPPPAPILVVD